MLLNAHQPRGIVNDDTVPVTAQHAVTGTLTWESTARQQAMLQRSESRNLNFVVKVAEEAAAGDQPCRFF